MGLFSTTKKTYVSTVTYPLGEDDVEERTDFLKQNLINAVLQGRNVGEALTRAYLGGQGIKLRTAFGYARDHYFYGLPRAGYFYSDRPDTDAVQAVLQGLHPGKEIYTLQTLVSFADFTWWAERFLAQTYGYDRTTKQFSFPPRDIEADALVTYDIAGGDTIEITLVNEDGFTKTVTFRPNDLSMREMYLHCCFRTISPFPVETTNESRPFESGDVNDTNVTDVTVDRNQELQQTYTKTVITTDGVTTTIKKTIAVRVMSRPQYFLYRLGAGDYPTLDAMKVTDEDASPYFPSVPFRIDNKDMPIVLGGMRAWDKHPFHATATKFLKKVGIKYDEVAEKINSNPKLGDIDFAFLTFGISLNTKSPEGRKYLYEFFDHQHGQQLKTKADFDAWAAEQNTMYMPYEKQAPNVAHCTLTEDLVRVTPANVELNERFL